MNDWNDLRFFLAVARGGGLTHAATALNVSPATVSRRIDVFEEALGAKLFIRRQTGYLLTDDGERMLENALPVEQAMLAFLRQSEDAGTPGRWSGKIRVACPELLAADRIAPRLGEFYQQYPGLTVELIVGLEPANLSRRDADMAVRIGTQHKGDEVDYIWQPLGELPYAAYVARTRSNDLDNWRALPHITWTETWAHLPMAKWLTANFPDQIPILTSNSMKLQHIGARIGLGLVVLPTFIGEHDSQLVRVEPDKFVSSRPLSLVFHRDLRDSDRMTAMRHFLTAIFKDGDNGK
jgi:DNA-binding transcriptional LysR family regulator